MWIIVHVYVLYCHRIKIYIVIIVFLHIETIYIYNGRTKFFLWDKVTLVDKTNTPIVLILGAEMLLPRYSLYFLRHIRDVTSDTSKYRSLSSSRRTVRTNTVNVSWAEDPIFPVSITLACTLVTCYVVKKARAIIRDHRPSVRTDGFAKKFLFSFLLVLRKDLRKDAWIFL